MIDISNNLASMHKVIPKEKLFDRETIAQFQVSDVEWIMSIKPGIRNVISHQIGKIRMEEIEVLSLRIETIPDTKGYLSLLSQIHSKIMYPCVVFFSYRDKYKIAAWKTIDSDRKYNQVVLKSSFVSSWIRDPAQSEKTRKCAETVRELLLNGEGNIRELYDSICQAILECAPQFVGSFKHLSRIIYDLCGKNDPILHEIEGTKRYSIENPHAKYQKRQFGSTYLYSYEYEDIWYALMNNERFRRIIENRRYADIEELIFKIDSKYG